MPRPLIVPNAVSIRLQFVRLPSVWYCVLFAGKNGAIVVDQALANAVGASIKSAFTSSALNTHISTTTGLSRVLVRDVSTANNAEFVDAGAASPGTAVGDLLPTQTALCITHRTARAGKSFRGRNYLPGFTETDSDANGHCVQAAATAAEAFFNSVRTGIVGQGLVLGVASRQKYDDLGNITQAGFITPITTSLSRDLAWETQRRRRI